MFEFFNRIYRNHFATHRYYLFIDMETGQIVDQWSTTRKNALRIARENNYFLAVHVVK